MSRWLDDSRQRPLWFQSAGNTRGQAWNDLFRDADGNGVMEFTGRPAATWTRELNFLAWQPHEEKHSLDLPEKMKLRIALVEDWARYKGRNGLSYHHQVVRAFPGGVGGLTLSKKDAQQTADVDLEELRKGLTKYLDNAAKEEPFPDSQRPMRFRNLSVVAFVQNDATQEILQAVQVAVREE